MQFATSDSITTLAESRWGALAKDPRTAELMQALIRHLHAFARETRLTHAEWFAATEWLARAGQITNDKRKEFILLSDVLGLSMVLELMHDDRPGEATQSTLLGPFFVPGSPEIAFGGRLPGVADADGTPLIVMGQVRDCAGNPLADTLIDTWQTDQSGVYEAQLGDETGFHYRGLLRSGADGRYMFRTVVPVDYPIPVDGPVGDLLSLTTISEFRPAHLHFRVEAPGHAPLVTHVFDRTSPYLVSDVVFGTREGLLVDFTDHEAGQAPNGDLINRPYKVLQLDLVVA